MKVNSYKDLEVWKRSISLVNEVYLISKQLPQSEQFGLASQIQRAGVSVASNIAEGYARRTTGDYLRFLSMSFGSAAELETQLIIIKQQYKDIFIRSAAELLTEVQKMLYVLMESLKK